MLSSDNDDSLAGEAIATARRWLTTAEQAPDAAERLSALLADNAGSPFVAALIDGVLRPDSQRVAAHTLGHLSHRIPSRLPMALRLGFAQVCGFAPLSPRAFVPFAKTLVMRVVGHLVLPVEADRKPDWLDAVSGTGGIRPVIAPIHSDALGERHADRQLAEVGSFVDEGGTVSFRLAAVLRWSDWDFDLDRAVDRLTPLFDRAAGRGTRLILEVDRFRELEPSLTLFRTMLDRSALQDLDAGITLPTSLPDSFPALQRLTQWAAARRARGGSAITVRLTVGDRVDDELDEAVVRGWPVATFAGRADAEAHLLRMLDWSCTPERTDAVRLVVASDNLFGHAFAWRLARTRGVLRRVEHEFRLGVMPELADAVKRDVGGIRLYTPTVPEENPAVAVGYLLRRIRDFTDPDAFLSAARDAARRERLFDREVDRFATACASIGDSVAETHRTQPRPWTTDTDPSIPESRDWARAVLEERVPDPPVTAVTDPDAAVEAALRASDEWAERRGSTRAAVLTSVAEVISEARDELIAVAVRHSGLTFADADHEVTQAIDLASRLATLASGLTSFDNATLVPSRVIVAVTPRHSPISEPASQLLSALAAGAAVIVKPAPETRASVAALTRIIIDGGVPAELVTLTPPGEDDDTRRLVTHPAVDRVLHHGSRHIAKLFRSWRPELPLLAVTGGRNSIIVTGSADIDAAVADVVASAFHHAGQSQEAVGTVILAGDGLDRFRDALTDAVASLAVGAPTELATEVGPLSRPARASVYDQLTALADGERWLVRPRQLDADGLRWSPGLREGVQPGTEFHTHEHRAPVLGIVSVDTLEDAIAAQNLPGFGLVFGLHSGDPVQVAEWLDRAEAGVLAVNRPTVRTVPSKQPAAGWNRSAIGAVCAEGGPNHLIPLSGWRAVPLEPGGSVVLSGISDDVQALITASQPAMTFDEFDWVRAAARSDETAWAEEFALVREYSDAVDRFAFRYRPVPVTVRLAEGAPIALLVRALAAATRAHAPVIVSSPVPLPNTLIAHFGTAASMVVEAVVESDARWHARVQSGGIATGRIRLVGGDGKVLQRVLDGDIEVSVHAEQVTPSGRIELLSFIREQSVRIASRRYGSASDVAAVALGSAEAAPTL